jgi:nitroimidazol reductase NimA-like FMN-containing flavoprotein (pyridoxamine 5'-phosphate oxidase superfamily)
MSDATVEAVNYIEKSPYALLVTVGEKNRPFVREIGPFVNDGLDIYFVTRRDSRKVRHVNVNSFVTLYFPNTKQDAQEFRSVAVTGKAARLPEGNEFNGVLEKLDRKSPGYKKYISNEGFKIWTIYKMTAESLQSTDYSKSTRTVTQAI